ncbi:cation-transporting ATPase 4 [Colletotrichum higginsianum]|nr:cation-transporting ATPase 4 [Colletotrichum higginsianum]
MGAATSRDMAAAVLVPLPFNLITMVLRFWIRTQRKAWGPDDWAMVATIVGALAASDGSQMSED